MTWMRCTVDVSGTGWGSNVAGVGSNVAGMGSNVNVAGVGSNVASVGSNVASVGSNVAGVGSRVTGKDSEDGPGVSLWAPVPKPDVMLANANVGVRNLTCIQKHVYSHKGFFCLFNALLLRFSTTLLPFLDFFVAGRLVALLSSVGGWLVGGTVFTEGVWMSESLRCRFLAMVLPLGDCWEIGAW